MNFAPVVEKVMPSVVTIFTSRSAKPGAAEDPMLDDPLLRRFFGQQGRSQKLQGLGSGVIVNSNGLILTSNHVVDDADKILVGFGSDKREYSAVKVGSDPGTDLAVLKIEGAKFPAITFANSDKIKPGEVVLAIGSPFGLTQTVTAGIISATGRGGLGIIDYENFIQTDAAINVGNSGGALVDAQGRLVGINSAILSRTGAFQGIGFAVPSNLAAEVLKAIQENGRVVRGYMGTTVQPLTPELAEVLKLGASSGALVGDVTPKSPAEKAGIKEGDVITRINGKNVGDARDMRLSVGAMPPGTKLDVEYVRDGKQLSSRLVLSELPTEAADGEAPASPEDEISKFLSMLSVADLSDDVRKELKLPSQVKGAVVVDVAPGSSAADAGLQLGDIVQEVNKQPVTNSKALTALNSAIKPGEKLLLRIWSRGKSGYVALDNQ